MIFSCLRQKPGFYRHLLQLSLPIILQNLISTSLGFVDTFMVGLLGGSELSAVTAANSLIYLLQVTIFGLTSGLSVLASQYWGRNDTAAISRAMGVVLYASVSVIGTAAVLFFLFPETAMLFVTDNRELIQLGAPYLKITGLSCVLNALASVYTSMQCSVENPTLGTAVFTVSVTLNTTLNYCLIFGRFGAPALGITGAAIATLISRAAECLMAAGHILFQRRVPLWPRLMLRPGAVMAKDFFRYSTPILFNEFMWGLGQTMMTVILGHMAFSAEMLAAFAVMGNIDKMATVTCYGLSDATAIILGKRMGQNAEREEIYRLGCCLLLTAVLLGCCISLTLAIALPALFLPHLFPLFQLNSRATEAAAVMCVAYLLQMPCRSFNNSIITGVLRSGGDVRAAIAVDLFPLWCLSIPLTAFLALVLQAPITLVCVGIYSENVLKMPLGILRLRSRKWINNITRDPS